MKSVTLLNILYIIEIIISNQLYYSANFILIKLFLFIIFFSFTLVLTRYDKFTNIYKQRMNIIKEKYEELYYDYIDTIEIKNNLQNEINNFDIPMHIKIAYINHLISKKHTCSICLLEMKKKEKLFLTTCGHLYHEKCINNNLNKSDKCPYCRKSLHYKQQYEEITIETHEHPIIHI